MDDAHLDIVEREQSDHGVVFALVPIFVDLFPDENDVAFPERQFPARKLYKKKHTENYWKKTARTDEHVLRCPVNTDSPELPGGLSDKIVQSSGHELRFRRTTSRRLWTLVQEVVVTVQRNRRFLRRAVREK